MTYNKAATARFKLKNPDYGRLHSTAFYKNKYKTDPEFRRSESLRKKLYYKKNKEKKQAIIDEAEIRRNELFHLENMTVGQTQEDEIMIIVA
jgi:hypothetical protein